MKNQPKQKDLAQKELDQLAGASDKEQEATSEFVTEYQALCLKHKRRIVVTPAYIGRDDGTFSTVLQQSVGALPKEK